MVADSRPLSITVAIMAVRPSEDSIPRHTRLRVEATKHGHSTGTGIRLLNPWNADACQSGGAGCRAAEVLEDEVGLGERDIMVSRQRHDELAERVAAGHADVHEEIVRPAEEVDVQHVGHPRHPGTEVRDVPACPGDEPYRDHGLQRAAERHRVDIRVVAADHTSFTQRADPPETGRRSHPDPVGQGIVGDPGVLGQDGQDAPVDLVDLKPKIVRQSATIIGLGCISECHGARIQNYRH